MRRVARKYRTETARAQTSNGRRPAGGWLITYADLMTILVCFFVLIISYSIQDQVKMEVVAGSMRDAFGVAEKRRFAGDFSLDGTPEKRQPGNIKPDPNPSANALVETLSARPASGENGNRHQQNANGADSRARRTAKEVLEKAILTHPLLKDAADAITISVDEDGLQIIIIDGDGAPMFRAGAIEPTPRAQVLLKEIAEVLTPLANRIYIDGHADATGTGRYSPFELTAARANAARAILEEEGFPTNRIAGIVGYGDAKPLFPEDPFLAGNRRIEIRLEKAAPLLPPEHNL